MDDRFVIGNYVLVFIPPWNFGKPDKLLEAEVREIVESLQAQLQESEPLVADLQDTKIH